MDDDKDDIVHYLINRDDINCAQIYTKGTSKPKSAIKSVGKSLGMRAQETDAICKAIDQNGEQISEKMRHDYPELFEKVDLVLGSVSNFGRHAGGILVSSENIREIIGLQTFSDDNLWTTQLDMLELEQLNLVKLDVLGLDNIGLINGALQMADLPFLTPDSVEIDFEDDAVWKSIQEDNTGIFQFESERAGKILSDILSEENLEKVRKIKPDIRRIELMSLANASQRPSGMSYVSQVTNGEFKDNGHEALNDFLSETQGFLVYQEQQSNFLIEFAGFSKAEADTVRKGISKKRPEIMDKVVPTIKPAFIKTMVEKYGDTEEHATKIADDFIQIFMDSVDYGFNKSHSIAYSYIGYISGWLRYYYPLEFTATALEIWQKKDKEKGFLDYARKHGVEILPPKFRKSKGGYYVDKENNKIYQGTGHIKGGNVDVGEQMYSIKDRKHECFTDVVLDVIENSSVTINSRTMSIQDFYRSDINMKELDKELKSNSSLVVYEGKSLGINKTKMLGLIRLGFFEEFGGAKKLEKVYSEVVSKYKPNNKTYAGKQAKYLELVEYEKSLEDEELSVLEACEYESFYTGNITIKSKDIPAKYLFVSKILRETKQYVHASMYTLHNGMFIDMKIGQTSYRKAPFNEGDLIEIQEISKKPKHGFVDGAWTKSETESELWLKQYRFIRKGTVK